MSHSKTTYPRSSRYHHFFGSSPKLNLMSTLGTLLFPPVAHAFSTVQRYNFRPPFGVKQASSLHPLSSSTAGIMPLRAETIQSHNNEEKIVLSEPLDHDDLIERNHESSVFYEEDSIMLATQKVEDDKSSIAADHDDSTEDIVEENNDENGESESYDDTVLAEEKDDVKSNENVDGEDESDTLLAEDSRQKETSEESSNTKSDSEKEDGDDSMVAKEDESENGSPESQDKDSSLLTSRHNEEDISGGLDSQSQEEEEDHIDDSKSEYSTTSSSSSSSESSSESIASSEEEQEQKDDIPDSEPSPTMENQAQDSILDDATAFDDDDSISSMFDHATPDSSPDALPHEVVYSYQQDLSGTMESCTTMWAYSDSPVPETDDYGMMESASWVRHTMDAVDEVASSLLYDDLPNDDGGGSDALVDVSSHHDSMSFLLHHLTTTIQDTL